MQRVAESRRGKVSADNFLGIYKVNSKKFIGRGCWSECENDCFKCNIREVFVAKSITEAIKLAEEHLNNPDEVYEYGYRFLGGKK